MLTNERMKRQPSMRRTLALAPALCLLALAACGGSSVELGVPPDLNGPVVSGQVSLPNGQVAASPSALRRLAQALVARVEALVAVDVAVRPVGADVEVRLIEIDDRNIVNGAIRNGRVLFTAITDANGQYAVRLPTGSSPGDCRFYLEVGNSAVTRAFIYAAEPTRTNVNFESEATVRLLLDEIRAGNTTLCSLNAADIQIVDIAVTNSSGQVFGTSTAALNASAVIAAAADPNVQRALAIAVGKVTPAPTATDTAAAEATATATVSATGTAAPPTSTSGVPTATSTRPNRTATSTATEPAAPPTRTPTVGASATHTGAVTTATSTASASNTAAPTDTAAPSNTAGPTDTATVGPSSTAAPTGTSTAAPVATATNTAVATATVQATNTTASTPTQTAAATPTAAAVAVNLGVVAGTAGAVVSLPVTLATNGAAVSALSNDIEYDAAEVDVVAPAGVPDCTIDDRLNGVKQVVAVVGSGTGTRKLLRVGVIGTTNNSTVSSGPLYSCRFALPLGAPAAITLLNQPEAASPQGNAVDAEGTDGGIAVAPAPASLGLAAGPVGEDGGVTLTASVNGRGRALAAVATDIRFDPEQLAVADDDQNGEPDCTVPAAVAGLGKQLFATVLHDGEQSVLRVGLVATDNNTALPETGGAVALFDCRFDVLATATTIVVQHAAEGAGPDAQTVALLGEPATIIAP